MVSHGVCVSKKLDSETWRCIAVISCSICKMFYYYKQNEVCNKSYGKLSTLPYVSVVGIQLNLPSFNTVLHKPELDFIAD